MWLTCPLDEASAVAPGAHALAFAGQGGSLFGIHLVNVFLTLVTVGVYYFWAKVRVRRYLLSQTEFEGDRFAYHGTGKELLVGFLRALGLFGIPYVVLNVGPDLMGLDLLSRGLAGLALTIVTLAFIGYAQVASRRYRLSRTSWRGIRFSFRGRIQEYVVLYLRGVLLTALTLGLYYPWFQIRRQAYLTAHAYFGNRAFGFDGRGGELARQLVVPVLGFVVFAVGWVLAVATQPSYALYGEHLGLGILATVLGLLLALGVSGIWVLARERRYLWNQTTFGDARFDCTITGWGLAVLKGINLVMLVGTLGLAWPWVAVRNVRFILDRLTLKGQLDPDSIVQDAKGATATGEGVSDLLDTGMDFGG